MMQEVQNVATKNRRGTMLLALWSQLDLFSDQEIFMLRLSGEGCRGRAVCVPVLFVLVFVLCFVLLFLIPCCSLLFLVVCSLLAAGCWLLPT